MLTQYKETVSMLPVVYNLATERVLQETLFGEGLTAEDIKARLHSLGDVFDKYNNVFIIVAAPVPRGGDRVFDFNACVLDLANTVTKLRGFPSKFYVFARNKPGVVIVQGLTGAPAANGAETEAQELCRQIRLLAESRGAYSVVYGVSTLLNGLDNIRESLHEAELQTSFKRYVKSLLPGTSSREKLADRDIQSFLSGIRSIVDASGAGDTEALVGQALELTKEICAGGLDLADKKLLLQFFLFLLTEDIEALRIALEPAAEELLRDCVRKIDDISELQALANYAGKPCAPVSGPLPGIVPARSTATSSRRSGISWTIWPTPGCRWKPSPVRSASRRLTYRGCSGRCCGRTLSPLSTATGLILQSICCRPRKHPFRTLPRCPAFQASPHFSGSSNNTPIQRRKPISAAAAPCPFRAFHLHGGLCIYCRFQPLYFPRRYSTF
jgi:hypothetical protein